MAKSNWSVSLDTDKKLKFSYGDKSSVTLSDEGQVINSASTQEPINAIEHLYDIPNRDLAKTTPNLGSHVLLVDDLADSGKTLIKSIKWLEHFYGFYFDEKIKTAVLWHKSTSKFKPDYSVDYLKDSPWIHMPFEKYETTNIKDFNFE